MVDLPEKLIKRGDVNKWQPEYDVVLSKPEYSFVKRFLYKYFRKFVEQLDNPFEVPWIRGLYNDDLSWLENFFKKRLDQINMLELEIENLLKELDEGHTDPIQFVKKINSLYGELVTYEYLKKKGCKNIKKIYKGSDWECDGKKFSVKSFESISMKYEYIEYVIGGLACIDDNEIIRKYCLVNKISNIGNFEHEDFNQLLKCLRGHLINYLTKADKKLSQGRFYPDNAPEEIQIDGVTIKVEMRGIPPKTESAPYNISISFDFGNNKNFSISFKKHSSPYIYLFSPHDTYLVGSEWGKEDIDGLKRKIDEEIKKVDKNRNFPDVLWINIPLALKFDESRNRDNVIDQFRKLINEETRVKTYILFIPTPKFSGNEPFLIESNEENFGIQF